MSGKTWANHTLAPMAPESCDILEKARALLSSDESGGTALQRLCTYIQSNVSGCDWVGFYIVVTGKRELALGPYEGEPTDHLRIPFGRGICGQAADTLSTIVVDDVAAESNYLSCSPRVSSEVVIPVFHEGTIVGELDIDSHRKAAFDRELRGVLESIARMAAPMVATLVP